MNSENNFLEEKTNTFRKEPVSFMRRGSRLNGRLQKAWDKYSDDFVLNIPKNIAHTSVHPDYKFYPEKIYGRKAQLIVEIGSGTGETILAAAHKNPEKNFLAIEVYLPGIAQTILKAAQQNITNLRIVNANASEALENMFFAETINEIWIFFPDPWPKKKHHKRRLIDTNFATKVAKTLVTNGTWRIATDWENYAQQILEVGENCPNFTNFYQPNWAPRFTQRPITSFEKKAHLVNRTIFDLCYKKINAPSLPHHQQE